MKKLPKDAEASNILIGELDELIVSNIISFLFLWDNFLLTNNRIYARMFNYKTSMPTCISDVVGYPKTRNPRGKNPTLSYPNPTQPEKLYPNPYPTRILVTFVMKTWKTPTFFIPEPNPNLATRLHHYFRHTWFCLLIIME